MTYKNNLLYTINKIISYIYVDDNYHTLKKKLFDI